MLTSFKFNHMVCLLLGG